jgi:hypothetical protein
VQSSVSRPLPAPLLLLLLGLTVKSSPGQLAPSPLLLALEEDMPPAPDPKPVELLEEEALSALSGLPFGVDEQPPVPVATHAEKARALIERLLRPTSIVPYGFLADIP